MEIKAQSKANLSVRCMRQERKPEDRQAVSENWEATFGKDCDECGTRHARHSPCAKVSDGSDSDS